MKFEVKSGKNLAEIIREFPDATVRSLVSEPGEDAWSVEIPSHAAWLESRESRAFQRYIAMYLENDNAEESAEFAATQLGMSEEEYMANWSVNAAKFAALKARAFADEMLKKS